MRDWKAWFDDVEPLQLARPLEHARSAALRVSLPATLEKAAAVLSVLAVVLGRYARQPSYRLWVDPSLFGQTDFQGLWPFRMDWDRKSLAQLRSELLEQIGELRSNQPVPPFLPGEWRVVMAHSDTLVEPSLVVDINAEGMGIRVADAKGTLPLRFVEHVEVLWKEANHASDEHLSSLPWMLPEEHERVTVRFAKGPARAAEESLLHRWVERWAQKAPDRIALIQEDRKLTYGQLIEHARHFAQALELQGLGVGSYVALAADGSLEAVVSELAILLAGGVYVPIDPRLPDGRRQQLLVDAAPRVVLCRPELAALFTPVSVMEVVLPAPESAGAWVGPKISPKDGCYIFYTSGTTGVPKGVLNQHLGPTNALEHLKDRLSLSPDDVWLQSAPMSFDASVIDVFGPLSSGARLVMHPTSVRGDAQDLVDQILQHRVTHMFAVPSMLNALLQVPELVKCQSLKAIVCGGEGLPSALLERTRKLLPHVRILNMYGPTECSIWSTDWDEPQSPTPTAPIGRPLPNVWVTVVDERRQPVPVGVPGELAIGGDGLGLGYLNRPNENSARFVQIEARSAYLTGDLVRWLEDGNIEFLGRIDHQVKIRGNRVELGDVDACLRRHPKISDAFVAAFPIDAEGLQLVGFAVSRDRSLSLESLREHMRGELPSYMVPSFLLFVDQIPTTHNGKVDRNQLVEFAREARAQVPNEVAAADKEALDPLLQQILKTCRELVPSLKADTDFFDAGLDSLGVTQVSIALSQSLGRRVSSKHLFEARSPRNLRDILSKHVGTDSPVVTDRPLVVSSLNHLPLTPAQFAFSPYVWGLRGDVRKLNEAILDRRLDGVFAISAGISVPSDWTPDRFHRALRKVCSRNPAMRARIKPSENQDWPDQEITPPDVRVTIRNELQAVQSIEETFDRLLDEEVQQPFDSAEMLFRASFIKFPAGEQRVILTFLHTFVDGWSLRLLLDELANSYVMEASCDTPPADSAIIRQWAAVLISSASENPRPYKVSDEQLSMSTLSQVRPLRGRVHEEGARVFPAPSIVRTSQSVCCALESLGVATEHLSKYQGQFTAAPCTEQQMRELAQRSSRSVATCLMAGYAAILSAYLGRERFAVAMMDHGRTDDVSGIDRAMGNFAQLAVADVILPPQLSFLEWIQSFGMQVDEQIEGCRAHFNRSELKVWVDRIRAGLTRNLPIVNVVPELKPRHSLSAPTLRAGPGGHLLGVTFVTLLPSPSIGISIESLVDPAVTRDFLLSLSDFYSACVLDPTLSVRSLVSHATWKGA